MWSVLEPFSKNQKCNAVCPRSFQQQKQRCNVMWSVEAFNNKQRCSVVCLEVFNHRQRRSVLEAFSKQTGKREEDEATGKRTRH